MHCRTRICSVGICGLLAVAAALGPVPLSLAQSQPVDWTFLVYLDGDNNLERNAIDDLLEMAAVGSDARVNVVVQFDRVPGYDNRYGDWTGTLRFRVTRGMTPERANAIADLGEANMGDPQTLIDFVSWGMRTFPARHTALVLWNHGDGWRVASQLKENRKAICWDDTNGRDALNLPELRSALAAVTANGATPLELLGFDACLMAMAEIDAEVQPYVRVRTASEETEPGTGYPFDDILASLQAHPDWDGAELGIAIVEQYYAAYNGETQSAVDLGDGYALLISAIDELGGALLDHREALMGDIGRVRQEVQSFHADYVDLYDLAELLSTAVSEPAVDQAARHVMEAVGLVTLRERHGGYWPGARGISIYFPARSSSWDSQYSETSGYVTLSQKTRWDNFLIAYLEQTTACDPDEYEPDNSAQAASAFDLESKAQRHNFCPATDAGDWVALDAPAGRTFQIGTSDLGPYCDTVLRVYGTDGLALLATDDDSGVGWASYLEWTSPANGTYYLQITEYYGRSGADTGYTLSVAQVIAPCQPDPYEPDGEAILAAELLVDGPAQPHGFCPADDRADWARFEGIAGQGYEIETQDLGAQCDTVVSLYGTDGTSLLLTDDDGGGQAGASRVRWTCPANGTFFVRVQEKQQRTGPESTYYLKVSTASLIVRGQVYLQGRTAFAGTQIIAEPTLGSGVAVTATTLADGSFALNTTVPCTLTTQHAGYLSTGWTIAGPGNGERVLNPVTLLAGDINSDREIDILDLAYIGAHFAGSDTRADLNQDGEVDILDLVLIAANFGKRSDAPG
jgi:hypothetical protein